LHDQAEARARNDIKKVVEDWVDSVAASKQEGCTDIAANAVVEGWAEAVAKAFTSVTNEVNIQGTGTACAEGFAQGDAFAIAIVEIQIEVTLQAIQETFGQELSTKVESAIDKGVNKATGEAVGKAVSGAIAEAWASASNRVCTTGGEKKGFDQSEAVQIQQAEAFLFAEVILTVCAELGVDTKELEQYQSSLTDSTSFVTGSAEQTTIVNTATGSASTGQSRFLECTGLKDTVCCSDSVKLQDQCECGNGCAMKQADLTPPTAGAKVWQDTASGDFCFCA